MKRLVAYIVIVFFFACEEERPENNDLLVIEGYLYAGADIQQIDLSLPIRQGSNTEVVDNAEVSLYDNINEYKFIHHGGGRYKYEGADLNITADQTYFLEIKYDELEIYAQTTVPSTPVGLVADQDTLVIDELLSDFIVFSWSNPDFDYYSTVIRSNTSSIDSIFNDQVDNFFFSYPYFDSEIAVYASNIKYFGENEFILYSVTYDYLGLYESTEQESGLVQPGNIQNGLGIFTSFSSDTVSFYVEGF